MCQRDAAKGSVLTLAPTPRMRRRLSFGQNDEVLGPSLLLMLLLLPPLLPWPNCPEDPAAPAAAPVAGAVIAVGDHLETAERQTPGSEYEGRDVAFERLLLLSTLVSWFEGVPLPKLPPG